MGEYGDLSEDEIDELFKEMAEKKKIEQTEHGVR